MRKPVSIIMVACTACLAVTPIARADVPTCSYNGALSVNGTNANDSLAIGVDEAGTFIVTSGTTEQPCSGGSPTVNNTTSISITPQSGSDQVTIDFGNGLFKPSAGGAPIPIALDGDVGDDMLRINGTPGNDVWSCNSTGCDFDGDATADETGCCFEVFMFSTLGGDDMMDFCSSCGSDSFQGPATVNGGEGNDTLMGTSGNDILTGGLGDDILDGAGGTDRLVETGNVNMTLGEATLIGLGSDSFTSLELATLTGGESGNAIGARAFAGAVALNGLGGNDLLVGGRAGDTLSGGMGNDRLTGGPGNDKLGGGAGTDRLVETGNVMTLGAATLSGVGSDTFTSVESATLTGGESGDYIDAQAFVGALTLDGLGGNDRLYAWNSSAATLKGHGGNDFLYSGCPGTLDGGIGDDLLSFAPGGWRGNVKLIGGTGTDEISGGNYVRVRLTLTPTKLTESTGPKTATLSGIERATLYGALYGESTIRASTFTGRTHLIGTGGYDTLIGGRGMDVLEGGTGNDNLSGGPSNDILIGGPGRDRCDGGDGRDTARTCESKVRIP